ncbi:MAG: hypothetical protein IT553_07995 [Sphingomonadaceae bacterium]|nr:hypothetical protein [Sphingomonadaceae bacterium]
MVDHYAWAQLYAGERALIDAVEAGRGFWPSDDNRPSKRGARAASADRTGAHIRADVLRAILLGMPIGRARSRSGGDARPVAIPPSGLAICPPSLLGGPPHHRVHISSDLNLNGLTGPGGTVMPPIKLEYCDFDGDLDLRGMLVGALSLQGSRLRAVNGSDADIRGSLNLSWIEPYGVPDDATIYRPDELDHLWPFAGNSFARPATQSATIGAVFEPCPVTTPDPMRPLPACVASFVNASVDGNIDLRGARLVRMPNMANPFDPAGQELTHALSLRGAIITGGVFFARSLCLGGCNFTHARIAEDIWFQDCRLITTDGSDALELQTAEVGGIVGICAMTGGAKDELSLLGQRGDFRTNIIMGRLHFLGLRARYLWIDNLVQHSGGGVYGQAAESLLVSRAIGIGNAEITDSIWLGSYGGDNNSLGQSAILGRIELAGTKVGGDITVTYFGACAALAATIVELLPMDSDFVQITMGYRSRYIDNFCSIDLRNIVVDGTINVNHTRLSVPPVDSDDWASSLYLHKSDVRRGISIGTQVQCTGGLRLERSHIGRLLRIECQELTASHGDGAIPNAIAAHGIVVDGDVDIGTGSDQAKGAATVMAVNGALAMHDATINGSLTIAQVKFSVDPANYARAVGTGERLPEILSFVGTKVTGRLEVADLAWGQATIAAPTIFPKINPGAIKLPVPNMELAQAMRQPGQIEVRARTLSFLRDYLLLDILSSPGSPEAVRHFLFDQRSKIAWPLIGGSDNIYRATSDSSRFSLITPTEEQAYLAFFCSMLRGDEGSFQLISDVDGNAIEYPEADKAVEGGGSDDQNMLRNLPLGSLDRVVMGEGRVGYYATVLYGAHIFNAKFGLSSNGMVEMLDDLPIASLKDAASAGSAAAQHGGTTDGYRLHPIGEPVEPPPLAAILPAEDGEPQPTAAAEDIVVDVAPADCHMAINLEQFRCGLIDDDFGRGWNLQHHMQLRLAGMHCADVEPSGEAAKSNSAATPSDDANVQEGSGFAANFAAAESTGTRHVPSAARSRADWLKYQFEQEVAPPTAPDWAARWHRQLSRWLLIPPRWQGQDSIREENFVPQTWDNFANAYMRAGEAATSRELMTERKDIESLLLAKRARWWRISAENWDSVARRPRDSNVARREVMLRGIAVSMTVATAVVALTIFLGSFLDPTGATSGANYVLPIIYGAGIVATIVMTLPAIVILGAYLFRLGFKYGLSVPRAIATFLLCIAVGAWGTHLARTGTPISLVTDWHALRQADGSPKPNIALVLATGYSTNAPSSDNGRVAGPIPGQIVYGRASFCNLGVSSWQYAMDVFIPVLDLDQESRCSIREENEALGSYNGWRWLKILYEMLGWVVTSLTILTITGVMRRDMERN